MLSQDGKATPSNPPHQREAREVKHISL